MNTCIKACKRLWHLLLFGFPIFLSQELPVHCQLTGKSNPFVHNKGFNSEEIHYSATQ